MNKPDPGRLCAWLDRSIAPVGTVCVALGVAARVVGAVHVADYLVATGVLFRLVVWLSDWLEPSAARPRAPRRATRIRPDTGWLPR